MKQISDLTDEVLHVRVYFWDADMHLMHWNMKPSYSTARKDLRNKSLQSPPEEPKFQHTWSMWPKSQVTWQQKWTRIHISFHYLTLPVSKHQWAWMQNWWRCSYGVPEITITKITLQPQLNYSPLWVFSQERFHYSRSPILPLCGQTHFPSHP